MSVFSHNTWSQTAKRRKSVERCSSAALGDLAMCLSSLTSPLFILLISTVHLHLFLPMVTAHSANRLLFDGNSRLRCRI